MSIKFINPNYLWFLLLILVPIIIHLFNFKRYKRIYFSNIKFLQQLVASNRKKSKLQELIRLLLRVLAIVFLVLAFARPYFSDNVTKTIRNSTDVTNIYIDNSFSMSAKTQNSSALEVAKNSAIKLIKSLSDEQKIRVYTNNFTAYSGYLNKNRAIARVLDIELVATPIVLSKQLEKMVLNNKKKESSYFLFSDFQKSQTDWQNIKIDSTLQWNFIPIKTAIVQNLSVDSCWINQGATVVSEKLMVKISNHANVAMEKVPVRLKINGDIKSVASISVKPNKWELVTLPLPTIKTPLIAGEITITDFPITYDNTFYFSINKLLQVKTLVINGNKPNKYVNKVYDIANKFEVTNINKAEHNNYKIKSYQLVVLNQVEDIESGFADNLTQALNAGTTLLYVPGNLVKPTVNKFFKTISAPCYSQLDTNKQQVASIERESKIYKKTFAKLEENALLPTVYKFYRFEAVTPRTEKLWRTAGNMALFTKTAVGTGACYQLAFNLQPDWSNLVTHPIFVPTMLNAYSNSNNNPLYYIAGKRYHINITTAKNAKKIHLIHQQNKADIIPYQQGSANFGSTIYTQNQIGKAGHYKVTANDSVCSILAFNYSRNESKPYYFSASDISKISKFITVTDADKMVIDNSISSAEKKSNVSFMLVILALSFFVAEGMLKS